MATVPAGAYFSQRSAYRHVKAEGVVEFVIGQHPSIGYHDGAAKLERQSAVELEPG